jgi:ribonuclease HII
MVMAGVVLLRPVPGLADSKKLSPQRREKLFRQILPNSLYHLVWFSPAEIDQLGLGECIHRGLKEIQTSLPAERYLFDGNSPFGVEGIEPVVKGDLKIPQISAASILAKVVRDRYMIQLGKLYPQYQFDRHKGYITQAHKKALSIYGYTPHHRKSYNLKLEKGAFDSLF